MPVGPPGTSTVSACLWPPPSYSVLELRASLATHHGPVELAASPQALTSCASARSETRTRAVKRSRPALLADPAAASAASATASAASFISRGGDRRRSRRVAPTPDQVAVPVEAVLGDALERRKVDVHDSESLR